MPGCRHDRAPSRGQSRKPVRPSGMTKPSAWRAFLRPAAYRTFWNAPRVAKGQPHGSGIALPDGGPGQTLLKVRHGIRLPCRSIPETEHHGPLVRQDGLPPLRPEIATKRAGCRAAPVLLPGVVRFPAPPTRPSLPVSPNRPSSARIASRPAACHAASLIKAYARRNPPLHRRKVPSHTFRAIPAAGSNREKKTPSLFTPQHLPSSPAVWHALFQTAARQRRGLSLRPEESFFGDGESTRGEGAVFTKNAPSPLVIPPLHSPSTTKKAGQSPAPAFTGKTQERGCVTSFRRYA